MRLKRISIEIIIALFVLLWVYAGLSKLLDYETFKIQLGKSPLLTAFPGLVAIGVPLSELLFAGMLLIKRFRLTGLYMSLFLMVLFTAYLVAILNFSYYIPCSCGGILSGLSWDTHIVFNIAFILLGIIGIIIEADLNKTKNRNHDSVPVFV